MVVLNVEGVEGIAKLDEILKVEGVDVVFLGPYDLSQSVGKPGAVDDPKVLDLIRSCAEKIRAAGLVAGCFARDIDMMTMLIECGYQYITYLLDATILLEALEQVKDTFRAHLKP